MKKEIHPSYQDVLFVDSSTGTQFLCGSTLQPKETETFEGKEYPVYRVSVSSASHPFFTGSSKLVDSEGRVDKFRKRYSRPAAQPAKEKEEQPTKAAAPKKETKPKAAAKPKKETKPKKEAKPKEQAAK